MAPETTTGKPGIQHLTCESVSSFVKRVSSIRARWTGARRTLFDPWFRGHENAHWPLVPSLYRFGLGDEETDLRLEFRRRALQLIPGRVPADDWQWYFLMQHHGAPTRLLDWTDSALVALFFAVSSNQAGNPAVASDAAVWMLDPWALNGAVLRDSRVYDTAWPKAGPYLPLLPNADLVPALPIAVDPPHFTTRVAVQRSHSTVFGSQADGLSAVARRHARMLAKITIPQRAIPQIRVDLGTSGIRDTSVFPDLEGLSRELLRFYTEP
jgi:FRG domain